MQRTPLHAMLAVAGTGVAAAAPKGLTIQDLLAMQRVGEPHVSPDGTRVAFAVRDTDYDANRGRFDIYIAKVDGSGGERVTTSAENDSEPAWSPDGRWLYFLSSRSGSSQVWRIALAGGEAEQVTKLAGDVNGFTIFPDGKRLALTADVNPDAKSFADSAKRDEDKAKSKVKAKIYNEAFFRHWDTWEDGKYSHLFVWTPERPEGGLDLTPGQATDTPVKPFDGMEDASISADGRTIAYLARGGGREQAWTTNTDVFLVATDGRSRAIDLTAANKAYDFLPTFSPDGRALALTMMTRPGFEADRTRLAIIDMATKRLRVVTEAWDRSVSAIEWAKDGRTIYKEKQQHNKKTNKNPKLAGDKHKNTHNTLKQPAELFTIKLDGSGLTQI